MGKHKQIDTAGILAAVRDGELTIAEAGRRAGLTRRAFEQRFSLFRAEQAAARSKKAMNAARQWLRYCQSIGFKSSERFELERLWWSWHDENGNLLQSPRRWYPRVST